MICADSSDQIPIFKGSKTMGVLKKENIEKIGIYKMICALTIYSNAL